MGICDVLGQTVFALLLIVCCFPVVLIAAVGLCITRCIPCSEALSKIVIFWSCIAFRVVLCLCCWIHIDVEGFEALDKDFGASGRPTVMLANHTSLLDVILALAQLPIAKVGLVKMFVSNHLFEIPGLGLIVKAQGQIAVPFKTTKNELDKFELDAELMAERMKQLEEHVASGGTAGWFPEGRMNRKNPRQLEVFRAGGFTIPVQLDVEIWGCAFVGNPVCWPTDAPIGGKPAHIGMKMVQVCKSTHQCIANSDAANQDERHKCIFLANLAHDRLQQAVNELIQEGYEATDSRLAESETPLTAADAAE